MGNDQKKPSDVQNEINAPKPTSSSPRQQQQPRSTYSSQQSPSASSALTPKKQSMPRSSAPASEIDVDKVYDFGIKKEDEIVPRTTTEEVFNFQDSYHDENVQLAPLNEINNDTMENEEEAEEEETKS